MNTHRAVKVLAEGNRRSDNSAQIEDGPEDRDELALLALSRVCEHERPLRGPEEAGTDAQYGPHSNDKPVQVRVNIHRPA